MKQGNRTIVSEFGYDVKDIKKLLDMFSNDITEESAKTSPNGLYFKDGRTVLVFDHKIYHGKEALKVITREVKPPKGIVCCERKDGNGFYFEGDINKEKEIREFGKRIKEVIPFLGIGHCNNGRIEDVCNGEHLKFD